MMRNSFEALPARARRGGAWSTAAASFGALRRILLHGVRPGADHGRAVRVPRLVERLLRAADPAQRRRRSSRCRSRSSNLREQVVRRHRLRRAGGRRGRAGAAVRGRCSSSCSGTTCAASCPARCAASTDDTEPMTTLVRRSIPRAAAAARPRRGADDRRLLGRPPAAQPPTAVLPHATPGLERAGLGRQPSGPRRRGPATGRAGPRSSPTPRSTSARGGRLGVGALGAAPTPTARSPLARDARRGAGARRLPQHRLRSARPGARAAPTSSGATSCTASATCSRRRSPALRAARRRRLLGIALPRRRPAVRRVRRRTASRTRGLRPPRDRDGAGRARPR